MWDNQGKQCKLYRRRKSSLLETVPNGVENTRSTIGKTNDLHAHDLEDLRKDEEKKNKDSAWGRGTLEDRRAEEESHGVGVIAMPR